MLAALGPVARPLVVTTAPGKRAADPAALIGSHARAGIEPVVEPSLRSAIQHAWRHGSLIVVAGSLYLAGAVMKELSLAW